MLLGNFSEIGGRQIHQDDMRVLQEELLKAIQLQYIGQGAFILQGCVVTGGAGNYTIGDGLVLINGRVMEFSTVSGIPSFPRYMVQAADVQQDSFPLEQGGSAYKRTLIKAELVSSVPGSGEFITMNASGGRNYNDILASQFVRLSGNQTVNGQKNFTSDVISNGLNINSEINNINSSLSTKANKVTTVTGTDGLGGGGDLSSNRVIGIATGGVTNSKIADGAVTGSKISNASISPAKLDSDTNNLFRGNGYSDDFSVDFSTSYVQVASRTYSNKLWNLTYNTSRVRPYVSMQIQALRDSGGVDRIRLELQRSNNPSSGFVTIAYRYYRLDADSWCTCVIDKVDSGAFEGANYYRLVATNVEGTLCWMSSNFSGTVFGVNIY